MNKECEIIQDLIPIYIDDVCSQSSKILVEDHVKGCEACQKFLEEIKNSEVETKIVSEKESVIKKQARFFKRKSATIGAVISALFLIPILVCFIVNLATGQGLSWFFIVLASLLLAASLIIVPLMMPQNKGLWTLGLGCTTLVLLFAVCCIYTKGSWFFIATFASLFGIALVFLPIALHSKKLAKYVGEQKALICMGADSILFWAMMWAASAYAVNQSWYWGVALVVGGPLFVYAWAVFALLRYPRCSKLIRFGLFSIFTGLYMFFLNSFLEYVFGYGSIWPMFNPLIWNSHTIDGNVKWLFMILGIVVGAVLIIAGIARKRCGNEK